MNAFPVDGAVIVPMTAAVISDVVEIHLESFGGYMNARLGSGYIRAFINWFCHARDSIALVALDGSGKVIGYVVGGRWDLYEKMNRDLLWPAVVAIASRPRLLLDGRFFQLAVSRLWLIASRIHPCGQSRGFALPEPTMALVALGVLSSVRGKGVGQRLARAFEARAQELKMSSMILAVYPNNIVARKLYEKCGWESLISGDSHQAMFYSKSLV